MSVPALGFQEIMVDKDEIKGLFWPKFHIYDIFWIKTRLVES